LFVCIQIRGIFFASLMMNDDTLMENCEKERAMTTQKKVLTFLKPHAAFCIEQDRPLRKFGFLSGYNDHSPVRIIRVATQHLFGRCVIFVGSNLRFSKVLPLVRPKLREFLCQQGVTLDVLWLKSTTLVTLVQENIKA
jgi:hypothetical protein